MFEPSEHPRVFAQEPGVDFPAAVVAGLRARFKGQPPEALAKVTVYVNTTRMKRRMTELFDQGPAALLPRIRLVTELGTDAAMAKLPPAVSPLRRRLELAALLRNRKELTEGQAVYPLADSLANLMDEMQGEGVSPENLHALDVSDHSAYWQRSLAFVQVIEKYFGASGDEPLDVEARQRKVIERMIDIWTAHPPNEPIIVAGSTGSRGATALFMEAVARLPQGAVILPGFDRATPDHVWAKMGDALRHEDHPQYRFKRIMDALDIAPDDIAPWYVDSIPPAPERNALISLALRPAPITDQWQTEGPSFSGVRNATSGMTLVEAPTPRAEASAIALILRNAAEAGREAALITPDRMLTRQVTAALDRWHIIPDDSAGRPLALSAPGRLMRHVADLRGQKVTAVDLLMLLKHPLTHTGDGRGDHLRFSRELELRALRGRMPFPDKEQLHAWLEKVPDAEAWVDWIVSILAKLVDCQTAPLADHLSQTHALVEIVAAGSIADGSGGLWDKAAGREARRIITEIAREAEFGGDMTASEFADLFTSLLNRGEVREPVEAHPNIKIWGTLEARVQGVDLVILSGLNEGVWPEMPKPDPWMNRAMRNEAGLLLPERRIGLSAHDFQQAVGAKEVVLTRASRDAESETVPSRWINRLSNLLSGMSDEGAACLDEMKARGKRWIDLAQRADEPQEAHSKSPAHRPSPHPPVEARPKSLSFTAISRLIRDPYAIYARNILGLKPLDPLHAMPDAALRGTTVHDAFEQFVKEREDGESRDAARARLLDTAQTVFEDTIPWPAARVLWSAKLERIVDEFLDQEDKRMEGVSDVLTEVEGETMLLNGTFRLHGKADRIDKRDDGYIAIYDYKTGQVPSDKQQLAYDKQLLLEAVVALHGGFKGLDKSEAAHVAYIGLGSKSGESGVDMEPDLMGKIEGELETILSEFLSGERGYTSRRVVLSKSSDRPGDFDHLARFGEWDHSNDPVSEQVGD